MREGVRGSEQLVQRIFSFQWLLFLPLPLTLALWLSVQIRGMFTLTSPDADEGHLSVKAGS